jgi:S1-C subfamily serine protease
VSRGVKPSSFLEFVQAVVSDRQRYGKVRYGWVGIYPREIPGDGVGVAEVEADSPATKAGIKPGDVILGIGDLPMQHAQDYRDRAAQVRASEEVVLRLARGTVKLRAVWLDPELAAQRAARRVGLERATTAAEKSNKTGAPEGVRVLKVVPKSLAATAGIRAGDVVRAVNQRPVRSAGEYAAALAALKPGSDVVLAIQRGSFTWYVPLQI